ncbi:MAG: hypothetical protein QNJ54_16175 [Prochloraceae cyanobacterium]|nr:hypothetical protein [Prochloraceae cyanobacterium]
MPSQFLSIRESYALSDFSLEEVLGSNTTVDRTLNYYVLGKNRAGINRLSPVTNKTIQAGCKLVVTFNESIRGTGEDLQFLILAAEDTGNPIDAVIIAVWKAKESDQITDRALSATIELTEDEHFLINAAVNKKSEFPASPINGMVREVIELSEFYQYDEELLIWRPISTNSAYISATTDLGGCDRSLALVEDPLSPPDQIANTPSTPIRLAFFNDYSEDGGAALQAGEQFGLLFFVNSQREIEGIDYARLFAGYVQITFLGYVRRSTGELDTTIEGAGSFFTWLPDKGLINLPAPLPRGYGAAWELTLTLDTDRVGGLIPNGSIISFNLYNQGLIGTPSDIGRITGDVVFNEGDRLRIVPNKRLGGVAVIGGAFQDYYVTPVLQEANLFGLAADTANQKVAISGVLGGRIFVRQPDSQLADTEALRAIVSTEPGIATASSLTGSVTIADNQKIRVTVTLPIDANLQGRIRSDYPDAIANTPNVIFNTPSLIPFVTFNNLIYQLPPVTVAPAASISFLIDSLSSAVVVATLPAADGDFVLYGYDSISAVPEESGSLAAGDYQVAIAWFYPSPNYNLTRISHSTDLGCIPEFSQNFADFLATSRKFIADVTSLEQMQALTPADLAGNPVVIFNRSDERQELYAYFQNYAGTIDDERAIGLNNASGAMLRIGEPRDQVGDTGEPLAETSILDTILVSNTGEILVNDCGNILTTARIISNKSSTTVETVETVALSDLLFSSAGNLLISNTGEILLANNTNQTDINSDAIVSTDDLLLGDTGEILLSDAGVPLVNTSSTKTLVIKKSDLDSLLISSTGDILVSDSGEILTRDVFIFN